MTQLSYLAWAAAHLLVPPNCPVCSSRGRLVRRKFGVTALRECPNCRLRFRTPKDDEKSSEDFYSKEIYKQGFTTDLPSDAELSEYLRSSFAGTEKDFSPRIQALQASGLHPGATLLDFGSSWGYGSWQMKRAGFRVLSYEIGQARALYARDKLGCAMVDDLDTIAGQVDCFFSSHVIEHLPDPKLMFEAAKKALKSSGTFVCYCPNGTEDREKTSVYLYDKNWGKVHPLMVTAEFMKRQAEKYGFRKCNVYSTPIDVSAISQHLDGRLDGDELLSIFYR